MQHQSNEIEMILRWVSTLQIVIAFLHLDKIIVFILFQKQPFI